MKLTKVIIYNIMIITIGIISPLIFNLFKYYFPSSLLIKQNDLSSLLNTLFQVQATLATLSLPIISLLIIFFNQRLFGVDILEYTFKNRNKYRLNLNEKAISLLIFVLIEYYFVATINIQGSLIVLFLTIFEIISILYFTLEIFTNSEKLKKDIRQHVKKILSKGMASNHIDFNKFSNQLYSDTRKRIIENDITFQENLDLYTNILIVNNCDYNKENYYRIQKEINNIVKLLIDNDLFEEAVFFIRDLYQKMLDEDSKISLILDKGYISLMEYLKNTPDSLMLYRMPIRTTLRNLFEYEVKLKESLFFDGVLLLFYKSLKEDTDSKIKRNMLITFFKELSFVLPHEIGDKYEKSSKLIKFLKHLIDSNEIDDLEIFFKYVNSYNNLYEDEKYHLYLAVIIYYYYLIYYEVLATVEQKSEFQKTFNQLMKYIQDELPRQLSDIYSILLKDLFYFEWMKEMEGKIVVIHNVIFEFLLFYAVENDIRNLQEIFPEKKSDDIEIFLKSNNIKEKYEKYKIFMNSDGNIDEFEEVVASLLNNK
ncbi:hypothetical protein ETI06_00215 [Macrococcoides goetzii]|nr:hypothetical protein [Macrococcus goetzii]TDM50435.1 hypothetical protein ETI06_00215 [Macrococcus goetzii]